jgi:hypothetical protein
MKYVIHGNFYIEGKLQCIKPCDFLYVGGVYMGDCFLRRVFSLRRAIQGDPNDSF